MLNFYLFMQMSSCAFVNIIFLEQTFQQGKGQFARKKNFTNEVDAPAVVVTHLKETEEERLRKQEAGMTNFFELNNKIAKLTFF